MMSWYEEFFDEDYMRFHLRGGAGQAAKAPAECDFIVKALDLKPGDRILDLCCGQGRHSVELARRGFQVTGAEGTRDAHLSTATGDPSPAAKRLRGRSYDRRRWPTP
jgi:cyclopropane fatty-acyl-phospholipid synthase-like methyltransferase